MAQLLSSVIEVSLVSAVIIGLLLLFSPFLEKKYTSRSLCIVWMLLALRLLVPVSFHLQQPAIAIPTVIPRITSQSVTAGTGAATAGRTATVVTHNSPTADDTDESGTNRHRLASYDLAAVVWAAGVVVFAAVHFAGYVQLRRNIRRYAKPIDDKTLHNTLELIHAELGIKTRHLPLLEYTHTGSPMLTGFIKPVILLPDTRYENDELALILRHELVHFKRRDLWFKLLLTCISALHWFNPFVHLMVRQANKQIENACDHEVVDNRDMQTRKKYSETLLAAMSRDQTKKIGLSTYYHGGKKTMKQRFKNIFDQKNRKRGTSIVVAVLAVIMLSGVLVACQVQTGATPTNSPSPSASASPSGVTETPSPSATGPSDGNNDTLSVAGSWAEAVKNRDGKAQYALMTKALQAKIHDEFAGLDWVTGTSSPWVVSYDTQKTDSGARVTFTLATSTGPAGSYYQDLSFKAEDGALKIDAISDIQDITASPTASTGFSDLPSLIKLLGLTKDELTKAVPETPVKVDEGGLGFDKTGIRVWFDTETYTKVAQVLILSDKIDISGLKLGDSYDAFKKVFGEPVSDQNGDAHFKYGDTYLSIVRDTATGKVISVYVLAENF